MRYALGFFIFALASILYVSVANAEVVCENSADIDGNHFVNIRDLTIFKAGYRTGYAFSDLNCDGRVDNVDFDLFRSNFGKCIPDYDLDGNNLVDMDDVNIFRALFGSSAKSADFDCNGVVSFSDLALLRSAVQE